MFPSIVRTPTRALRANGSMTYIDLDHVSRSPAGSAVPSSLPRRRQPTQAQDLETRRRAARAALEMRRAAVRMASGGGAAAARSLSTPGGGAVAARRPSATRGGAVAARRLSAAEEAVMDQGQSGGGAEVAVRPRNAAEEAARADAMRVWDDSDAVDAMLGEDEAFKIAIEGLKARVPDLKARARAALDAGEVSNVVEADLAPEIEALRDSTRPSTPHSVILYMVYNKLQRIKGKATQVDSGSLFDLNQADAVTVLEAEDAPAAHGAGAANTTTFSPVSKEVFASQAAQMQDEFGAGDGNVLAKQFIYLLMRQYKQQRAFSELYGEIYDVPESEAGAVTSAQDLGQYVRSVTARITQAKSVPDDQTKALTHIWVEIGGHHYRCRVRLDTKYIDSERKPRVIVELHKAPTADDTYCVTMYNLDDTCMYVDWLYYGVDELGERVGQRMSAKELFKFVKEMGFDTIALDDASSIHFTARQPINAPDLEQPEGVQYPFEVWPNLGKGFHDTTYQLSIPMTLFNLLKHTVLQKRQTLRVYADAAAGATVAAAAAEALPIDPDPHLAGSWIQRLGRAGGGEAAGPPSPVADGPGPGASTPAAAGSPWAAAQGAALFPANGRLKW